MLAERSVEIPSCVGEALAIPVPFDTSVRGLLWANGWPRPASSE